MRRWWWVGTYCERHVEGDGERVAVRVGGVRVVGVGRPHWRVTGEGKVFARATWCPGSPRPASQTHRRQGRKSEKASVSYGAQFLCPGYFN